MGWLISVESQISEKDHSELILASWNSSWGALEWITELVKQGKATQHGKYGYPNSYTALAKDVLPLIKTMSKGFSSVRSKKLHNENIKNCSLEEELRIEACDMS